MSSAPYLLVAGDFVPTGGMDMANLALARYLARDSEVHLVCHRADPGLLANKNVFQHLSRKPLGSYLLGEPLLNWQGQHWANRLRPRKARILTNGGNCVSSGANWVHYVHSVPFKRKTSMSLALLRERYAASKSRQDEDRAFKKSSVLIANSLRTAQDLAEFAHVPSSKVRVVYYGVDSCRFTIRTEKERLQIRKKAGLPFDRPLAIFVGALGDLRKGFDKLFECWQILCSRPSWDANLVVIGRGSSLPIWQAKARQHGIAHRIHFLGFRSDVPDLVSACDVMVAPSRYEAYGLAVQEALCSGIPAFVSARAGVAERYPIDLQQFLIQDVENSSEIAELLDNWRNGSQDWKVSMADLTKKIRSRSWQDMASEIEILLNQ